VVARYLDEDNYYVARANALEDNVRLYRVVKGKRQMIASWKGKVAGGIWHTLELSVRGDRLEVRFDDRRVLEARDRTFSRAGRAGLWTKADSVIYFDDLVIEPL
jgi:hypothetical protein